jgi:DNA-binding CsgD family transcriptional regulator
MENSEFSLKTVGDENEANFDRWRSHAASSQAEYQKVEAGCKLLTGSDRVLMEMVIKGDHTYLQLAKLLGKSHVSVLRRIRQLTAIILGQSVRKVRFQGPLKPVEQGVARLVMVQRLSRKQIALEMGLSRYRVDQICRKLAVASPKQNRRMVRMTARWQRNP